MPMVHIAHDRHRQADQGGMVPLLAQRRSRRAEREQARDEGGTALRRHELLRAERGRENAGRSGGEEQDRFGRGTADRLERSEEPVSQRGDGGGAVRGDCRASPPQEKKEEENRRISRVAGEAAGGEEETKQEQEA